ncbi:MAG: hypothetical protein KJN63_00610 [Acidimicrobiia bacterium]|nr:hypothetical protein [Acidimicrobiia bacterium]
MRWFNPSHPQTMQAAVVIGYISGFFALLGGARFFELALLAAIAILGGAFGTANNKRIGWIALLAGSSFFVLLRILDLLLSVSDGVNATLFQLNATVFPVALLAAVLHPHTREYMKVWFE